MYFLLFNFQCIEFLLLSYWSLQALATAALTTVSGVALPCFSVPHTLLTSFCSGWVDPLLIFFGPCLSPLLDLLNSFPNFLHWKILKLEFLLSTLYKHRRPLLPGVGYFICCFYCLSILITFKIFCYCFSWWIILSNKI